MKELFRRICGGVLAIISVLCLITFSSCGEKEKPQNKEDETLSKLTAFHQTVLESKECLDDIGNDVYQCWYNAIFKGEYDGNTSLAVADGLYSNPENFITLDKNEQIIKTLYQEMRDTDFTAEVKAVVYAYYDYYDCIVNVSGSFNNFSTVKNTLQKKLERCLKNLFLEI